MEKSAAFLAGVSFAFEKISAIGVVPKSLPNFGKVRPKPSAPSTQSFLDKIKGLVVGTSQPSSKVLVKNVNVAKARKG